MIDHDSEPQTEMGVFLSKTCRSVWNSVFDRLINLISLKSPSQLRYLFPRFGTGSPSLLWHKGICGREPTRCIKRSQQFPRLGLSKVTHVAAVLSTCIGFIEKNRSSERTPRLAVNRPKNHNGKRKTR